MRPLELRIRNFRSYFGDDAVFDFRGRRLVGIVGPIGSGKSSILDAVAFALYGKTPTVAAATKSLIHQRADGATVALRFEVEDETWQVVRALRRKGQSQHSLVRLATDSDAAEELERVVLEADVNERIVELLGLGFDAFSKSVLLAQGRFAEFLKSRPAERDKVLKGVFGHDRIDAMRELAKRRADALAVELEKIAVRIAELERIRQRQTENEEALAVADMRIESLRKAEPRLDDLAEREQAVLTHLEETRARIDRLAEHGAKLPDAAATSSLLAEAGAAESRRTGLAEELDRAQQALTAAERQLDETRASGVEELITAAAELLSQRESTVARRDEIMTRTQALSGRVAAARGHASEAKRAVEAAEELVTTLRVGLAEATSVAAAADEALHEARHADMAASLRHELVIGEPCPVCAQMVAALPEVRGADVTDAVAAAEAARHAKDVARDALAQAESEVAVSRGLVAERTATADGLDAELAASETSHLEVSAALDEIDEAIRDLLGPGEPADLIAAQRAALQEVTDQATAARREVDRARTAHDEAIVEQQNTNRRLADLRMQLTELATRLDVDTEIPHDAARLGPAVAHLLAAWSEVTDDLEDQARISAGELDAIRDERAALLSALELSSDFATELAGAVARAELLIGELARARVELDAAAELHTHHTATTTSRDGYEQIAGDLTNSGFIRFLLDDERARLAELGSDHFERLSSGRYRFSGDGRFDVIDLTSAEAIRKADSLSGGETFVASLGLALALAEMVTRTGGRLDSFFIDEGFGSLDPEHLDLAMEGIEALAAEGESRLVVVVSHVPELRQRIEDLVELDREALTGDTKIVRA